MRHKNFQSLTVCRNKQAASPYRRGNYWTSRPGESLVEQAESLQVMSLNLQVAQSETVSICRGPLGLRFSNEI